MDYVLICELRDVLMLWLLRILTTRTMQVHWIGTATCITCVVILADYLQCLLYSQGYSELGRLLSAQHRE